MGGRLYNAPSSITPAANSGTAATAGTAGTFARGDHAHPSYNPLPGDQGFLAWNYDIAMAGSGSQLTASGTILVAKLNVPVATLVTYINLWVQAVGATLTSGQSKVALYDSSKNLVSGSTSADQSTAWTSTGLKAIALGTPASLAPGTYYIAMWSVGSTMPAFRSVANVSSVNANLLAADSRWATANTSITTTAPSSLGAFTAVALSPWVGLT
jgi:hypothetical protein